MDFPIDLDLQRMGRMDGKLIIPENADIFRLLVFLPLELDEALDKMGQCRRVDDAAIEFAIHRAGMGA